MKKGVMNIILVIVIVASFIPAKTTFATSDFEIRVGLTALYSGKTEIRVNNPGLRIGYVKDKTFVPEANFMNKGGFTFGTASGYYVDLGLALSSYTEVLRGIKTVDTPGRVMGAVTGPGKWRVYVWFSDRSSAEEAVTGFKTNGYEAALLPGNNYRLTLSFGSDEILIDVDEDYAYPQFEALSEDNKVTIIDLGTRSYRGRLEVGRYQKAGITAVNIVKLEEYLYSVVSSEMPESYPIEALKAQAVASRSYAIVKGGLGGASDAKNGYRINDTTDFQVYRGYTYENDAAIKAVAATQGETVNYNSKVIEAYYFSSGGGATESSEAVWNVELPYLQGKPDLYEGKYSVTPWRVDFSYSEIGRLVAAYYGSLGTITGIDAVKVSESGRVSLLRIKGELSSLSLQTSAIRSTLGLKGTKFKIVKYGDEPDTVYVQGTGNAYLNKLGDSYVMSVDGVTELGSKGLTQYIARSAYNFWGFGASAPAGPETVYFYGLGSGHGVGMSQTGAAGMAAEGYTYKEILEYYYSGCKVS